jgi:hypothetical protein
MAVTNDLIVREFNKSRKEKLQRLVTYGWGREVPLTSDKMTRPEPKGVEGKNFTSLIFKKGLSDDYMKSVRARFDRDRVLEYSREPIIVEVASIKKDSILEAINTLKTGFNINSSVGLDPQNPAEDYMCIASYFVVGTIPQGEFFSSVSMDEATNILSDSGRRIKARSINHLLMD